MPGRASTDTLVSPMTALGRYNPYKKAVVENDNVMNDFVP